MAKRTKNDPLTSMEELQDELLGPVEDWPIEDVFEILNESSIDIDGLKRRLYDSASELAGSYHTRDKNVPAHLADFLDQLRPADLPTGDPKIAARSAEKWIRNVLRRGVAQPIPELQFSFRGLDEEISSEDLKVLEDIKLRLKQRSKEQS